MIEELQNLIIIFPSRSHQHRQDRNQTSESGRRRYLWRRFSSHLHSCSFFHWQQSQIPGLILLTDRMIRKRCSAMPAAKPTRAHTKSCTNTMISHLPSCCRCDAEVHLLCNVLEDEHRPHHGPPRRRAFFMRWTVRLRRFPKRRKWPRCRMAWWFFGRSAYRWTADLNSRLSPRPRNFSLQHFPAWHISSFLTKNGDEIWWWNDFKISWRSRKYVISSAYQQFAKHGLSICA